MAGGDYDVTLIVCRCAVLPGVTVVELSVTTWIPGPRLYPSVVYTQPHTVVRFIHILEMYGEWLIIYVTIVAVKPYKNQLHYAFCSGGSAMLRFLLPYTQQCSTAL